MLDDISGEDFYRKLYSKDFHRWVGNNIMPPHWRNLSFGISRWTDKNILNFPGPFYTGCTDNCGTGVSEASFNVMYDEDGREFIYRQPANVKEIEQVLNAGFVDPFDEYCWGGNLEWTPTAVKAWWQMKPELIARLQTPEMQKTNGNAVLDYILYLETTAEDYLRKYCFALEHDRYPNEDDTLPMLEKS